MNAPITWFCFVLSSLLITTNALADDTSNLTQALAQHPTSSITGIMTPTPGAATSSLSLEYPTSGTPGKMRRIALGHAPTAPPDVPCASIEPGSVTQVPFVPAKGSPSLALLLSNEGSSRWASYDSTKQCLITWPLEAWPSSTRLNTQNLSVVGVPQNLSTHAADSAKGKVPKKLIRQQTLELSTQHPGKETLRFGDLGFEVLSAQGALLARYLYNGFPDERAKDPLSKGREFYNTLPGGSPTRLEHTRKITLEVHRRSDERVVFIVDHALTDEAYDGRDSIWSRLVMQRRTTLLWRPDVKIDANDAYTWPNAFTTLQRTGKATTHVGAVGDSKRSHTIDSTSTIVTSQVSQPFGGGVLILERRMEVEDHPEDKGCLTRTVNHDFAWSFSNFSDEGPIQLRRSQEKSPSARVCDPPAPKK